MSSSDGENSNSDKEKNKKIEKKNYNEFNSELLKVVKEKEKFPCKFNNFVDLKEIMNYYNKNWGEGTLDEEENDGDDDSEKVSNKLQYVSSSSSSSSSKKKKKKKNIYDSSSSG